MNDSLINRLSFTGLFTSVLNTAPITLPLAVGTSLEQQHIKFILANSLVTRRQDETGGEI